MATRQKPVGSPLGAVHAQPAEACASDAATVAGARLLVAARACTSDAAPVASELEPAAAKTQSAVRAHATRLFRRQETAEAWLQRPNSALGGRPPVELLTTDRWREVDDVLGRIEHGIVS